MQNQGLIQPNMRNQDLRKPSRKNEHDFTQESMKVVKSKLQDNYNKLIFDVNRFA